jgi:hypothetical protein
VALLLLRSLSLARGGWMEVLTLEQGKDEPGHGETTRQKETG